MLFYPPRYHPTCAGRAGRRFAGGNGPVPPGLLSVRSSGAASCLPWASSSLLVRKPPKRYLKRVSSRQLAFPGFLDRTIITEKTRFVLHKVSLFLHDFPQAAKKPTSAAGTAARNGGGGANLEGARPGAARWGGLNGKQQFCVKNAQKRGCFCASVPLPDAGKAAILESERKSIGKGVYPYAEASRFRAAAAAAL